MVDAEAKPGVGEYVAGAQSSADSSDDGLSSVPPCPTPILSLPTIQVNEGTGTFKIYKWIFCTILQNSSAGLFSTACSLLERLLRPRDDDSFLDEHQYGGEAEEDTGEVDCQPVVTSLGGISIVPFRSALFTCFSSVCMYVCMYASSEWEILQQIDMHSAGKLSSEPAPAIDGFLRDKVKPPFSFLK